MFKNGKYSRKNAKIGRMTNSPGEPPTALIVALVKILRPLVRLLMSHGITLPYFSNLLKAIYVDVAEQDFTLEGKTQTDSRISLITGVHRKDVRRLRSETRSTTPAPNAVSMGAQVIATWVSDKKYVDAKGMPKQLPIRSNSVRKRSFEQLVATVSRQDLRPRVVLDELLRLGIVSVTDDEIVVLEVDAFVPARGFDEKAHYFGQNLRDHIAVAAHNLGEEKTRFLERAVSYHGLSNTDVAKLRLMAEELAMDALKAVNTRARQMQRRNQSKLDANQRINFGAYFFTEQSVDESEVDDLGRRGDGSDDDD